VAKTTSPLKTEPAITCSAGYFYQQPVGLGRYFAGVAANDNRSVTGGRHRLYAVLASLALLGAVLLFLA
jgi:hypothetical protein